MREQFKEMLTFRHATKSFNDTKVSKEDLNYILEAGHMTPNQVKVANTIMSHNMKQAIKDGTETSFESFERKTGVKINYPETNNRIRR